MCDRAKQHTMIKWLFFFYLCCLTSQAAGHENSSDLEGPIKCRDGLILPVWMPQENLSSGDRVARGIVYFVAMAYMFIGVSIVADRFMASIEVITSKEKEVVMKKPNGETQSISVRIWNETVSNLTLMALGSSAPEILLSIIEVYAQDFEAGELGPGTIVGSAAFNMFVIIGICVWAVPSTENRRIKHLRVFFVTMTWSVFAYIWLYIILTLTSPGVIDVWEGLVTFMFFPATVLTAYIADRQFIIYKYMTKKYRMNKRNIIVGGEGGEDLEMGNTSKSNHILDRNMEEEPSDDMREFEEHRMQYIQILRDLRRKHPDATMEEIEMMAREEILERGPKSRAYYRLQATRKLMGGTNLMRRKLEKIEQRKEEETDQPEKRKPLVTLSFDPGHYTVMENVGEFAVRVVREGDITEVVSVRFATEDGTANAGSDYEASEGTLVFGPGETEKHILLSVIDDDVFEEDEHFYVRLSDPRYVERHGREPPELATPSLATVMILDDDHSGIFLFETAEAELCESVGAYSLRVLRLSGARGRVHVPFRTVEGSARAGFEYEHVEGEVIFENNESEREIPLRITDKESYETDAVFYVELGEPKLEEEADVAEKEDYLKEQRGQNANENPDDLSEDEKIALLGKPRLGENYRIQIRIKESREFKNTVDKLFQKANISLSIGTSSWKEQFIEAITVSAGDDDDGGDDDENEKKEPQLPSCSDYVMHFITLFWKLVFAFIPPADMLDGWLCFVVSILGIGLLTAFIGDLASHFGCTVGLKDTVTAVALVALGTSIPDTFASKVAAIQDKYADSSIGNVTGSNAVNVFLGIGIAWSIAAIVHYARGSRFEVDPGSLAFSVTIFCSCAFLSCIVLLIRRNKRVGGELGGPFKYKLPTTILFVTLWLFYVLMASLEAYGMIEGF